MTRPVVEQADGRDLEFERIAEVRLKGFTALRRRSFSRRARRARSDAPPEAEIEQLRPASRACSRRGVPSSCCCRAGATRRACSTSRCGSPGATSVIALHVNYGLRDGADADERHCAELCARLGVALEVERPGRPRAGNLQAWARDERYGDGRADRPGARGATSPPGTPPPTRSRRSSTGWPSSPSRRALLGMRPREGLLVRPLLEFTREQTAAYCAGARAGLARGREQRRPTPTRAPAIRAELVPALRGGPPGRRGQRARGGGDPARRGRRARRARRRGARGTRPRAAGRGCVSCRRRCARLVVQRLADDAAGGPAPGAARRAAEILRAGRARDRAARPGRRACARSPSTACCGSSAAPRALAATTPEPVLLAIPGSAVFGEQRDHLRARTAGARARRARPRDARRRSAGAVVAARRSDGAARAAAARKSLQDLFTARRVPRRERGGVPVVESDGEIAWVAGVATSERFKVTDATAEAVRLSVRA